MGDWYKILLFIFSLVLFFWGVKVYYIWKSNNWVFVDGEVVKLYPKGSEKNTTVNVRYFYSGKEYINDAWDNGGLDVEKDVKVGQAVTLKVNPDHPYKCVVKSEPRSLFVKSAMVFANIISDHFPNMR